jgi:hypothetical protein
MSKLKRALIIFAAWFLTFIFAIFVGMWIKERQLGLFDLKEDSRQFVLQMQNLKRQTDGINGRLEKITDALQQIGIEIEISAFANRLQNRKPEGIVAPKVSGED